MKKLLAALPTITRDVTGLAGAVLVSVGAGMIYRPAGLIVAGAFLLVGAVLDARA